ARARRRCGRRLPRHPWDRSIGENSVDVGMDKQSANLLGRLIPRDIALNVRGYSKTPSSHFYRLQFAVTLPNDEKAKLRSRSDSASAAQPPGATRRLRCPSADP